MTTLDDKQLLSVLANAQATALSHMLRNYPLNRLIDTAVRNDRRAKAANHANPLLRHGEKYFSQNDEDGIVLEIMRRVGLSHGSFIEFGVGNGTENNSLILLMLGWRGAWAGNEELAVAIPAASRKLVHQRGWITRENAWQVWKDTSGALGLAGFDLLSIDLDGNDLHILQELLKQGARPAVVCVEYNGKFPPPIQFCIDYDPLHRFESSDYFGASLQSFADVLNPCGYRLVACNITGLNAFFIADSLADKFADVPEAIDILFVPADYATMTNIGHPVAPKTITHFLRDETPPASQRAL